MKETTRLLELIKYFTLVKRSIRFTANADATIREITNSKYTKKSGYFNIESIILDYGSDYFSSLKEKEQHIFFGKCPVNISGSYNIPKDASELMTPAIVHDYVQLGKSFKRYIFPSTTDSTYTQKYKSYNEWHDKTVVDLHQNYYRTRSFNILIEQNSVDSFNSFLNESYSQWKIRFDQAKEDAKSGNFYYFSLFDPRIYKYELTFTDRIRILEYMIYLMDWPLFGDRDNVDVSELFISLITNTNPTDGTMLSNYMFTLNPLTKRIYLKDCEDKLSNKLYDSLIIALLKSFYSTKTIKGLFDGFTMTRLYPIGFYEQTLEENVPYFDLDTQKFLQIGTHPIVQGIKYNTLETTDLKIIIDDLVQYRSKIIRVELEKCKFPYTKELNFNDVIYITPYLNSEIFKEIKIPYGCIIPIPAFALEWYVDKNEDTGTILEIIGTLTTLGALVFPVSTIAQGIFEGISYLYSAIGLGFTIINNTLGSGIQDQIKRYDKSKSTPDHPCMLGSYFLSIYYLLSSIYGTFSLKSSLDEAGGDIKVLFEVENLIGAYGAISDFRSFMAEFYPGESLETFNSISKQMEQIKNEYNKYKYLQSIN